MKILYSAKKFGRNQFKHFSEKRIKEVEKKIQSSSSGGLEAVVKELDAKVKSQPDCSTY